MPNDIHFDFAAALLLVTIISGLVAGVDRWWWSERRLPDAKAPGWVETAVSFFPVLLFVLVLRSFIVEPFRIPSGSMLPTLEAGDFILVNKFAYGVKMPALHFTLVPTGQPERGDVAVFRFPASPEKDFIKRIVGLPGDTLEYVDKVLKINGEPMSQSVVGPYPMDIGGRVISFERRSEDLAGRAHEILHAPTRGRGDLRVEIPQGHYFVMGDNRDGSDDSRRWGFVPQRALVGKAFFIWMNWSSDLGRPDWSRIGDSIQ